MKKYNNPTASYLRPFLINEIQMDLSVVNSSLKELGVMELKDDNLKKIAKLKEEVCNKLLELDDYIDNIKIGGKSDVHQEKSYFVDNSLKDLLIAMDIGIIDCKYILINEREYVKVTSQGGSQDICVNGDSFLAIVYGVTRRLLFLNLMNLFIEDKKGQSKVYKAIL